VLPWLARADRLRDDFAKLPCRSNAAARSSRNKRCCNLASKPFFAIVTDHFLDLLSASSRKPLCSGRTAARIHAHVELGIRPETKTPRWIVELRG
jgi:hypothetical protein